MDVWQSPKEVSPLQTHHVYSRWNDVETTVSRHFNMEYTWYVCRVTSRKKRFNFLTDKRNHKHKFLTKRTFFVTICVTHFCYLIPLVLCVREYFEIIFMHPNVFVITSVLLETLANQKSYLSMNSKHFEALNISLEWRKI